MTTEFREDSFYDFDDDEMIANTCLAGSCTSRNGTNSAIELERNTGAGQTIEDAERESVEHDSFYDTADDEMIAEACLGGDVRIVTNESEPTKPEIRVSVEEARRFIHEESEVITCKWLRKRYRLPSGVAIRLASWRGVVDNNSYTHIIVLCAHTSTHITIHARLFA